MSAPAPGLSDPGPLPELAWLPVAKLTVDPRYQRSIETPHGQRIIERIAVNFKWLAFQAILAAKSETGWTILDGQHRVEAARRRGIDKVPAVVVAADNIAAQAEAFVRANSDRVNISTYALHFARLTAGDEAAVALDELCRAGGIAIARSSAAGILKAGETQALISLSALLRRHGRVVTLQVVKAVAQSYAAEPGALRAAFFAGAASWIIGHAANERPAAARQAAGFFAKHRGADLNVMAARYRVQHGGTERAAVAAMIKSHAGAMVRAATAAGAGIAAPDRQRLMAGR
jgi:hypothetical protein